MIETSLEQKQNLWHKVYLELTDRGYLLSTLNSDTLIPDTGYYLKKKILNSANVFDLVTDKYIVVVPGERQIKVMVSFEFSEDYFIYEVDYTEQDCEYLFYQLQQMEKLILACLEGK